MSPLCALTALRAIDSPSQPRAVRGAAFPERLKQVTCSRFHDLRHRVITELAEMGVADHLLESISGHLSRRMLEHYSHIRIDAKRQALDALDAALGSTAHNGEAMGTAQIRRPIVEVRDDLTSHQVTVWFCAGLRLPVHC
jgi:hypothetical protein